MPRKDQGWITFQTSEEERQLLETICQVSQRTKTEVLREMLRGLKHSTPTVAEAIETSGKVVGRSPLPLPTAPQSSQALSTTPVQHQPKPLKVSSRNVLAGRIKRVIRGPVSTEVTLEIVQRVELTSTITTTSADSLELEEGKSAYAVIKSSDVVIAMD